MFVFKVKKGINQAIKISEKSVIEATKRGEPFYQTVNGKKRHYAYCPVCENPVILINVHVDNQYIDEAEKTLSMHARHIKSDVSGVGKYSQDAYDSCPYANPSSSKSKVRRPKGTVSNELLWLIKTFPDAIDTVMRRDVGILASETLFEKMLTNFKEEDGHLYRYVSKPNLPYSFMYMADSQDILFEKTDINYSSGRELKKLINENATWCFVSKYGTICKKKNAEKYVRLTIHFTDFEIHELDSEKYQKFSFIITESYGGQKTEILKKEVKFDQFYYLNIIEKRMRYINLAKNILGY
ncbi:MAG TPA: hypothetical protein ENH88_05070 [Pseudoalteromonas prydzensis]|uniref:Uncharacterized protein n=2 Tax=root TaxID=1 RepID=A0A7V1GDF1_9GAMM|nr:hypothetical protein [Pseudoalteromonas prydzensis]HEA15816.1 hypothetical protein [Pseudoalteromonas prydzensis]